MVEKDAFFIVHDGMGAPLGADGLSSAPSHPFAKDANGWGTEIRAELENAHAIF
jgi:hypothetical protein